MSPAMAVQAFAACAGRSLGSIGGRFAHVRCTCPVGASQPLGARFVSVAITKKKLDEQTYDGANSVLARGVQSKQDTKRADRLSGNRLSRSEECKGAASIMNRLTRERNYKEVVSEFQKVECPDVALCSAVLSACAKGFFWDDAINIWHSVGEHNRDVATYSAMLDVCKRFKKGALAEQLWAEMIVRGLKPNVIAYNTLIGVHAAVGNGEKALEVFEEARGSVFADVNDTSKQMVYVAVMSAFSRLGDYARTRELFVKLIEDGVPPNHLHFNVLMTSCARAGDITTAQLVFDMIPAYGLKPRSEDYIILLSCARFDIAKAKSVLAEFVDSAPPQILDQVRVEMLEAYVLAGDAPAAQAIIDGSMGTFGSINSSKVTKLMQRLRNMTAVPSPSTAH